MCFPLLAAAPAATAAGTAATGAATAGGFAASSAMMASSASLLAETGAVATSAAAAQAAATAGASAMSVLQMGALAASTIGGLSSAYGTYRQQATSKAVAKRNAQLAEIKAQDDIARGEQEAIAYGRRARQFAGEQRVGLAAHGLDLGYGTAADLQEQTGFFAQNDINTIRNNAQRSAWNSRMQGQGYQMQADSLNPWMAAGGSLLQTGGYVADKWYRYSTLSPGYY